MQAQHYLLCPEGSATALPQQREGFKPLPADDLDGQSGMLAADEPATHTALAVSDAG